MTLSIFTVFHNCHYCLVPELFNVIVVYLFWAALGLCCFMWAFSNCSEQGLLLAVVRGLLIPMASLVVEHGL